MPNIPTLVKAGEAIYLKFGSRERESWAEAGWRLGDRHPSHFRTCGPLSWLFRSTASLILVPSLWYPEVGVWSTLTLTRSLTAEMETHLLALHPPGEALVPSARVRVMYTHMHTHRGALRCRSRAGVPQAWGCEDRAIRADTSRLDRNAPLPSSAYRPARLCQSDPKPL